MKQLLILIIVAVTISSCGKDKFKTEPQIEFISFTPNSVLFNANIFGPGPVMKLRLTDKEGDFGFSEGEDTSYVYVKNITIPPFKSDSFRFPSSTNIRRADLDAEILVDMLKTSPVLGGSNPIIRPFVDTLFFEVYVRDFAGNKSNVIKTDKPLFFIYP